MSFQIVPLHDRHLEDAAALVTTRYRAEREHTPSLPPRHESVDSILPLVRDTAALAPGVAAIRDGRLVGFLLGLLLAEFRGKRSIYCPEWANAIAIEESGDTFREMYAHLAARWVANGCFTHLITILAHDHEVNHALHWQGFGLMAVDAMRDLSPVASADDDVDIRRATLEDTEIAMAFGEALSRYLAAPPTFLAFTERRERRFHEDWLAKPSNNLWLAYVGEEAVACIGLEPSNPKAAYVISDAKTLSITRAFTKAHVRGTGIGTALLRRSLAWVRSAEYERCAVDFEPENITGSRFWLRHFQPVCFSFNRHIDQRAAWAHQGRAAEDIW